MKLSTAKATRRCRICENPIQAKMYRDVSRFITNGGEEFAHKKCLDKQEKQKLKARKLMKQIDGIVGGLMTEVTGL